MAQWRIDALVQWPPATRRAPDAMPSSMSRCTLCHCAAEASGPMCVPSSAGSPTACASASAAATASASAYTERSTSMRVGALQLWPLF
eukprot:scaffold10179_cov75-Phaeocystis_antarctica.AAC.2